MTQAAALLHFRRLCDLPVAEREQELALLDAALATMVRRMLDADTGDDLKLADTAALLSRAMHEVEADDAEAQGQVPDHIGPFRPVERLGGGATSHVYLAWQTAPRRLIALKIVRRGVPAPVAARFHEEAQALADLRLPAAPQVYAVGTHEQRTWLAMERVEGTPLLVWARAREPEEIAALIAEIGDAIQTAHDAGMIHRDLKPEHVLVTSDGRPRLLDFGLTASDGEGLGTPAYMPPESLGGAEVGGGADTYALGVLLMELLHGGLPAGWTLPGQPRRPPSLAGVDPELRAVVRRAVSALPADRYPSPAGLAEDLRRALRHEPVSALPPGAARSLRLAVRRHRRVLLQLCAALLLAGLGTVAVSAWRAWAVHEAALAHEARAELLAQNLSERLRALRAEGAEADAVSLLDLMSRAPDLARSAALSRLWLDEGLFHRSDDASRAALVEAAAHPDTRSTALAHLAASFHRAALPVSLARVAASLPDPRWREAADLWSRRVPASPAGPLGEVLHRLAAGTPTAHQLSAAAPAVLDGASVLTLVDRPHGLALLAARDPALTTRLTLPPQGPHDRLPAWLVHGTDLALLTASADRSLALARPEMGDPWVIRPLGQVDDPLSWTLARTHEGAARVYLGTGPSDRALHVLRPDQPPVEPHPQTRGSDVNALLAADLTGDGRDELVAAVGPWQAYEVRAYTAEGEGLRLLDQLVLGNVDSLAVRRHADGVLEVVAAKSNRYANRVRFGDDAPFGRPAGLYLLRLVAGRWQVHTFVPLPVDDPDLGAILPNLSVGDVDGDGRSEVYAEVRLGQEALTWIVDPDHPDDTALLAGARPLTPADVDGDGRDELIVGLPDRDGQTWVLGAGTTPLPPLERPDVDLAEGAPDAPGLDTARLLAQLGLIDEAARRAAALAELATPGDRRALLTWSARLASSTRSPGQAAAAWLVAATAGAPEAWPEVQRHAALAHDPVLLRAASDALGEDSTRRLGPREPVSLHASPGAWRVVAPEAVAQWSDAGPTLTVFTGHGDVLATGLHPQAELFQVEVLLEITDFDPYASVSLSLRRGGEEQLYVGLLGATGGGRSNLRLRCGQGIEALVTREREPLPLVAPVRFTLRVAVDTASDSARCTVLDTDGEEIVGDTRSLLAKAGDDWSITLRAHTAPAPDVPDLAATRVELRLLRAELLGATAAGGQAPDDPAQAWARGDGAAALRVWQRTSPALAAWGWFELGHPDRAQPPAPRDVPCCLLHRLSRLQPWGVGAWLATRQSPAQRLRFLSESLPPSATWPGDTISQLLDTRLDGLPPTSDDEHLLLIQRARMIEAAGHPARARAQLRGLLARPPGSTYPSRAHTAYAATSLAQNLVRAGVRDEAAAWVAFALGLSPTPESLRANLLRDPLLRDLVPMEASAVEIAAP